jgi:chorismate-pyruvate lyase
MTATTNDSIAARSRSADVELSSLDPLERLLLASDGTLTDMLEALYLETVSLITLDQHIYPAPRRLDSLELDTGELVLERRILLRGARSGRSYVYANSLVAVDRLAAPIRWALLNSDTPLGKLWKQCGTELFKQVLQRRREPAAELVEYFDVPPESSLLVRTYRAYTGGSPVAVISEHIAPLTSASRGYGAGAALNLHRRDSSQV